MKAENDLNIVGLIHAGFLVENTARALNFYQGVLGLPVSNARPDLGYPGAWIQVGRQQIHLMEVPNPAPTQLPRGHGGRDRHLALTVTTLEAIRHALDAANIPYTQSSSGRMALFCRDPDGNALEFTLQR